MKREDEKAGIAKLASSASTQPTAHLSLEAFLLPGWLFAEVLKREEVSLRVEMSFDRHTTRGNQFVLQVFRTDKEPQSLHLDRRLSHQM